MHPWFKWITYVNPISYAFESLMVRYFVFTSVDLKLTSYRQMNCTQPPNVLSRLIADIFQSRTICAMLYLGSQRSSLPKYFSSKSSLSSEWRDCRIRLRLGGSIYRGFIPIHPCSPLAELWYPAGLLLRTNHCLWTSSGVCPSSCEG